jgi:predicted RNA-binding protein with PUA-like domain
MSYWLMKSEPDAFSIDDLARLGEAPWDGVRNFQARNFLRAMQPGDLFLFYHSSCTPPGLAGIGEVVSEPYPDRSALDPMSPYHDPAVSEEKLPWTAVRVAHRKTFERLIPLQQLRELSGLEGLALLRRGSRLSVMPVSPEEWAVLTHAAGDA